MPQPATWFTPGSYRRVLWLLVGFGFVLRITRLGTQSVWVDEGMTIAWIAEIETRGWRSLIENIHGPLHAAAVYLVSRVSTDEAWLRLPSVVAGTLAIPAVAELGRRLWGTRVGLTAAALLTVSPFVLYYSQEVRNYAFTILFASLTMLAAWNLLHRPTWRAGVVFVALEICAVLSNLNGVFLALGLNLWLVFALPRSRHAWAVWLLPHVIAVAVLAPYGRQALHQVRPERLVGVETGLGDAAPLRGDTTLHPMSLPYTAFAFAGGYSIGPTLAELRADPRAAAQRRHWLIIAAVVVGFGVPLLMGLVGKGGRPAVTPVLVVAVAVIGFTIWLAATNIKPFNARYLSVLYPIYVVLVARGVWLLRRPWRGVTIALILIISLWSCANYLWVPRYGRDDARGAIRYVLEHADPSALVIHINLGFPLRYYDDLPQRVKHAEPQTGGSLDEARRYVDRVRQNDTSLWFLESRTEKLDPSGYLRRACEERAMTSETRDFVGIRVHHFEFRKAIGDSAS